MPDLSRLRVLIVQPMQTDGPAFLATWLRESGVRFDVCRVEAGDAVPVAAGAYDALAMQGGTMSVNDDLPFLRSAEQLMRDGLARGVPILGHCLGGQMLARALGAPTTDHPEPEIGWSRVQRLDHALARQWLGEAPEFAAFQWHYQSFALPPGATLLASSAVCAHQAYAWANCLGMQFHIEVDAEKLTRWHPEAPEAGSPLLQHAGVQDETAMRAGTARWLADSQRTAAGIYARWLALAADRAQGTSA